MRRHPELLDEACALRAELPTRSAAQIAAILFARHRIRVAQRTINQHLRQRGLHRAALGSQARAFGRFEASHPNELWIGDVLVGSFVPYPRTSSSRRSYLFMLLDDYSRLILHARWVADQNTRAGQDVLRAAIQGRGVPEQVYFDNGAPYSNAALERTCAVLGIRLIHSRPYAPEGRGKVERLNRFIRERFLTEAEAHGIASFIELNDRFLAWAEQVCNTRRHAETSQTPIDRFTSQGPLQGRSRRCCAGPSAGQCWARHDHGVRLVGRQSSVDPSLIGRRVELRFDPEDLTHLDVFWESRPVGVAIPFIIGRHVHHQVPQAQPPTPPPSTGVDYLGMVVAAHEEQLLGHIAYRDLPSVASEVQR